MAKVLRVRDDGIYIVGAGAQTPIGRSVLSAAAAVRCGISASAEHPYMLDRYGEPMVVARAPWLDDSAALEGRIITLAIDAAREAIHPIVSRLDSLRRHLRVHVALSAENLADPGQRQRVLDRFAIETNLAVETARRPQVECVVDGHAGGLLALERAARQLVRGEAELCLVGAADSWMGVDSLEALDYMGRLHSVNERWGFTPGEGAAFCLVTTGAITRRLALTPLAELLSVASGHETNVLGTETVCTGDGLTAAFRRVLDRQPRVGHSYNDLNGETYRAEEYGFTICRTAEAFENADRFTAPAECWGDAGAASGLLAVTMPIASWARGYDEGAVQLAWSSSATSPLRAAALLRQPTASSPN
jgi:3-oxoacyl-[acyl-carrier-protein] synthase-1